MAKKKAKKKVAKKKEEPINVLIDQFVERMNKKKELEAELKKVKGDLEKMNDPIVDAMTKVGFSTIKTTSGMLVYINRTVAVNYPKTKIDEMKKLLKKYQAGSLIKEDVNSRSFAAWVRENFEERESDGMPDLPEDLAKLVTVFEKFDLRMKKA